MAVDHASSGINNDTNFRRVLALACMIRRLAPNQMHKLHGVWRRCACTRHLSDPEYVHMCYMHTWYTMCYVSCHMYLIMLHNYDYDDDIATHDESLFVYILMFNI